MEIYGSVNFFWLRAASNAEAWIQKVRISVPPPKRGKAFGEVWPLTPMPNCQFSLSLLTPFLIPLMFMRVAI